jgi:ankyrin repeat protein
VLLKNGADPNVAMYTAIHTCNDRIVHFLIEKGADHCNALKLAVEQRDVFLVRELCERNPPNEAAVGSLEFCIRKGLLSLVAVLLSKGCPQPPERQLLKLAVEKGNFEMVQTLLQFNAKPDSDSLQVVVKTKREDMLKLLLEAGVDVNYKWSCAKPGLPVISSMGAWTPLHEAARSGLPNSCRMLLEAGADPNAYVYFEQHFDFEKKVQSSESTSFEHESTPCEHESTPCEPESTPCEHEPTPCGHESTTCGPKFTGAAVLGSSGEARGPGYGRRHQKGHQRLWGAQLQRVLQPGRLPGRTSSRSPPDPL